MINALEKIEGKYEHINYCPEVSGSIWRVL
jgi:hypothetical protein